MDFWLKFVQFIANTLKDSSLARAKFEQRITNSALLSSADKIEIMLENAKFEEI